MILIRGARQLLTLQGPAVRRGGQLNELSVIVDGSVLVDGDKILRVGPTRQVENLREARRAQVIEAHGKVVMPGFVDSCTQIIGGAPVLDDFKRHSMPGHAVGAGPDGIHHGSFRTIRNTSPAALRRSATRWLMIAVAHGTTSLEVRSAQALHLATEGKALRAARDLNGKPLDIQPVILVAYPPEAGPQESAAVVRKVIEELLPDIQRRALARYCAVDVSAEGFSAGSARRIIEFAMATGFKLKIHTGLRRADAGARLAVEMRAASLTHAAFVQPDEIVALAESDVVVTLLPGVSYQQSAKFAPARDLIDSGVAVALASGFGAAGGPTMNMSSVLSLACSRMDMTAAEAISAATANGAAALGLATLAGSLEPGKQADVAIFDTGDYREMPYYLGINLCLLTMKKGRVIYRAPGYPGGARPMRAPARGEKPPRPH
ncbi:MAG: amidohydrolase family protein [Acidobacteria bacterium]|nr:amidohydrolase family protein [Acidobacteriota bacterium]